MIRTLLLLVVLGCLALIAPWAVLIAALMCLPFHGRARRAQPGPVRATPAVSRLLPGEEPGRGLSALEHRFRLISGGRP